MGGNVPTGRPDGGVAPRRGADRHVFILGAACAVEVTSLILSGVWLKYLYRPTEALAWQDIQSLHTSVTVGLLMRSLHRWSGLLFVVTMPTFGLTYAMAAQPGPRSEKILRVLSSMLFVAAIGGPAWVSTLLQDRVSTAATVLRRWMLVHELPAYVFLAALACAVAQLVLQQRRTRSGSGPE